ncbi:zinc ABC transporter substrate-binding protein [Isoptericola sp. NEAU-Y5]|uniref:Zinc ABC transporter substrate-binding protein n=1 Tax=Isoptericola luteus TaxID=2879484 RepID=A0ABS7ZH64_9MICO|nr:metal ABC transporter substrate-binding protein [Isoptericola sp. NEAU-Y5]MCA5893787.1 zinc ABC transporter substrate-binding protein [Isoptericola sp. NEAU-Y5]
MPTLRTRRPLATPLTALITTALAAGALGACASPPSDDAVEVVASFYPLQFVAERVGGEHTTVHNLTPPAADPHGLELSPARVRLLGSADVVVYLSGMQAATDEAVAAQRPDHVVDTAEVAGPGPGEAGGQGTAADTRPGDAVDPHFWQDPALLAAAARRVADELAAADPGNAADYAANAAALADELAAIDEEYRTSLAPCAGATLVTSHEAFGYLAERYDLNQVGIVGLDPEVEPSPARLRHVRSVVRDAGVETIYFEVITSPKVAQALVDDLGVATDRLDPLEGQSDAGSDYLDVMRANLAALRSGLVCDEAP